MDHVLGLDREVDGLVRRQVQLRRGDLLAALALVIEGPRELLADDAHVHRARPRGLLDVGQHDVGVRAEADEQDRRDRRPDDLQPRVAVDRRAVLELLAGTHPELDRAVEDDRLHEHEDRHRRDQQDVPQRVDLLALRGCLDREPVDPQGDARCRWQTRLPRSGASASPQPDPPAQAVLQRSWLSSPMDAASYGRGATEVPEAVRRLPAVSSCACVIVLGPAVGPEVRGRHAAVAAERLGELRRLPVAHAVRDLAHRQGLGGQHLSRAVHADAREVIAERGSADLGVGALQLASGRRHTARDVVQRELRGVLMRDDRIRFLEEAGAQTDGAGSLSRHVLSTARRPSMDHTIRQKTWRCDVPARSPFRLRRHGSSPCAPEHPSRR